MLDIVNKHTLQHQSPSTIVSHNNLLSPTEKPLPKTSAAAFIACLIPCQINLSPPVYTAVCIKYAWHHLSDVTLGLCLKEQIRQDFLSCLPVAPSRNHLFTSVMLIESSETLPEKSINTQRLDSPSQLPCLSHNTPLST